MWLACMLAARRQDNFGSRSFPAGSQQGSGRAEEDEPHAKSGMFLNAPPYLFASSKVAALLKSVPVLSY
jgi:hypothetical protein